MANIKSKAIEQLMRDLDSSFIKKSLMADEEQEVELPNEKGEELEEEQDPMKMLMHEIEEGAKVEKEEHPSMGSGEAEQVAKDHLDENEGYYDEDMAADDVEAGEEEGSEKEPKGVMISMSRIAAKPVKKAEVKKILKGKK